MNAEANFKVLKSCNLCTCRVVVNGHIVVELSAPYDFDVILDKLTGRRDLGIVFALLQLLTSD